MTSRRSCKHHGGASRAQVHANDDAAAPLGAQVDDGALFASYARARAAHDAAAAAEAGTMANLAEATVRNGAAQRAARAALKHANARAKAAGWSIDAAEEVSALAVGGGGETAWC